MHRSPAQKRADSQPHPLWLFEENYLQLRRLFPVFIPGKRYLLSSGSGRNAMQVRVDECGRYTTALTLTRPFEGDEQLLPPLVLQVRVYHDARLAEVTGYQECRNIPPSYKASTANGYLRDERKQVNRLLYEVLTYCRRHGYVVETLSDEVDAA